MESEIGARDMLRAKDAELDLKDQGGFPARLKTDFIQPVSVLNDGGFAHDAATYDGALHNLVGLNEFRKAILGPLPTASIPTLRNNVGLGSRVLGLDIELDLDAAGATALNGKVLWLGLLYVQQAPGPSDPMNETTIFGDYWCKVTTGITVYRWALGGFRNDEGTNDKSIKWDGYVPRGFGLLAHMGFLFDGVTTFPANSQLFFNLVCAQGKPGQRLPL